MAADYLTAYWVDKNDIIESVSLFWDDFALANEGREVVSAKVCGKPIWEFIADEQTVTWLKIIFENVRRKKAAVERQFRCDSPLEKRFMLMRVSPMNAGGLFVENILMKTELRRKPVFFEHSNSETDKRIYRCSICGKIKKHLVWTEPEAPDGVSRLNVVYTVCNACHQGRGATGRVAPA